MASSAANYYCCRKSGQIPAFGHWEYTNDLPITQYFECARQAGLLRCSCSGECPADLYAPDPRRLYHIPQPKTKGGVSKGYPHLREQRKQVKVRDLMMDQPRNHQPSAHKYRHSRQTTTTTTKSGNIVSQKPSMNVKPVDEDLYKIPSELLENSKKKKVLGFFSRCMVPPCAA